MVVPLRTKGEAAGDRAPAAAVFVSDPEVPLDSNQQHLRELYALTVVEARLAAWLAQGKSVHEAAAAMGITVNTARAYLKRIYDKTGVRRQPELVRVLLSLPRLKPAQGTQGGRAAPSSARRPGVSTKFSANYINSGVSGSTGQGHPKTNVILYMAD